MKPMKKALLTIGLAAIAVYAVKVAKDIYNFLSWEIYTL